MIVHESDGWSGGLLLMWRDEISVRMQGVTKNYIDVIIEEEGGLEVYGNIWHAGVEPERKNMGCNMFN